MANLFVNNKNAAPAPVTERSILAAKYNRGVANLLLVILFTVINIVLLVTNANRYFLFSAFVPYLLADYGMYFTGLYPEEYYYDAGSAVFFDKSFLTVMLVIGGVILLLYFLCWLFGRKQKVGWLIFATILFAIDTAAMLILLGISSDMILDLVFHGWVVISLIMAISAYFKMKKLPEEVVDVEVSVEEDCQCDSTVLRMADMDVKARILLEAEVPGYRIVYRRVKKTNELVVNGRVYDEYVATAELPHTLSAVIDGHKVEVCYDNTSRMYIYFNGEQLAKKLRLI